MPPKVTRPPADAEADASVAATISALQAERLSFLSASAQAGAFFAVETDPEARRTYAEQVQQFERNMARIEAVITELSKIAGKANSGNKLAKTHDDNLGLVQAWLAANPVG